MMRKLITLSAFGAGYVLGARAGRERYEQLREVYEKVKNDPRVQEQAQRVADTVEEKAEPAAQSVKDSAERAVDKAGAKASEAAGKAQSKASEVADKAETKASATGSNDAAAEKAGDGELNPDRLKLTEETGPQGKLP